MKRAILVLWAALSVAAVVAQQAGAAAAPTATTGAASSVTSSSAVVSGTVNPSGQSTTYSFSYGTTTAYGSQTSAQAAGADSTDHAVTATLTGLKAARTYHYRVSATNASGTTVGSDASFTTAPAPPPGPRPLPTVTTGPALHIGQSGAAVTGTVNPMGLKTTYYFEFGVSPYYGVQTTSRSLPAVGTPQTVSITLHGLAPGQVYHYRLVARNSNGTTRGTDRSFSTAGAPRKRVFPAVTARATPRRDRRRQFRFTIRGRVVPPKGINARQACRGKVTVRFKAGRKTVLQRQVKLNRRCRYLTRVRFKGRQRRYSSFRITVHFLGNTMLKPRWARSQYVRVG